MLEIQTEPASGSRKVVNSSHFSKPSRSFTAIIGVLVAWFVVISHRTCANRSATC